MLDQRSTACAPKPKQLRETRASSPHGEGAREAALAEVKLVHEDARRAREDVARVRLQLEQQIAQERERADARVEEVRQNAATQQSALERELQSARELTQQARTEVQRVGDELTRQRESSDRQLADEKARAEARLEEVRAGLQAQLLAAQQLAEERKQAREQRAQQLEVELARATSPAQHGRKKNRGRKGGV